MDTGKMLLGATGGMLLLAVVTVAFVMAPSGLLGGGPPASVQDLSEDEMPAGVTKSGVENASATAQAHRNALLDTSYSLSVEASKTVEGSNGGIQATQEYESDGDGNHLRTFDQDSPQDYTITTWTNESVAVSKLVRGNQTAYQKNEVARVTNGRTGSITVREFLKAGEFEPTAVENQGGQQVVVLTADEPSRQAADLLQVQSVQSFDGRVEIGPDGIVRNVSVEVTFTARDGNTGTQTFTQTVEGIGSTDVQKPSWVPTAIDQTSDARLDGPEAPAVVA